MRGGPDVPAARPSSAVTAMTLLAPLRALLPVFTLVLACTAPAARAQDADSVTFSRAAPRPRKAGPTAAQRRKLDFVPAARFEEARRRAVRAGSQGSPVHVAADQETSYVMAVRTDSSEVEQHARWDDIIVVRSGRGGVSFGERAIGRRTLAPGEFRGGRLAGAWQLHLAPGDVARIPAGVPHLFWRSSAEPFEYLVIKVRRGDRPITPP